MRGLDLVHRVGGLMPPRVRRLEMFRRPYERAVIARNFEAKFGRPLDLTSPQTFNEKVAYKMAYDRRPILTRVADKARAREYVMERVGAQYLPELYQICHSAGEIEWRALPRRFVIKATHGSSMNIFVREKSEADMAAVASEVETWLAQNIYYKFREWAYREIPPAILIEEFLIGPDGRMPENWKFLTFGGRTEFLRVDQYDPVRMASYDRRLSRLRFRRGPLEMTADPALPRDIDRMFWLAEELCGGLDFVRVDMYNVNGRIVFGEFTNYPSAGLSPFYPAEFDTLLGSRWRVPRRYERDSRSWSA